MARSILPVTCAAVLVLAGCGACSRSPSFDAAAGAWPADRARLTVLPLRVPPGFVTRKVYVDAGHGAPGNTGNLSSWCEDEQDFTLAAARHLAASLQSTGHFEARVSRESAGVPYADRVREAEAWGADAFVSLHSDVRGVSHPWSPGPGLSCPRSDEAPGFAVLFSDEAPGPVDDRRRLAERLAGRLGSAGFVAYDGGEYTRSYEAVGSRPGVFIDRHAMTKRIYVLRQPTMPSVLVETHNALHAKEAARFREAITLEALDAAVASALVDLFVPSNELSWGR